MVDSTRENPISSPLLETKLFIPRPRAGLVARVGLIERLNQASAGKLTLVSAPAGFGKTTLLAEWLATAEAGDQPAAWLALDQSDNEPALFWSYVIAALQTVRPEFDAGQSTLALLQSLQPLPGETVLSRMLNEVGALAQDIVLVLDDYHLITAPPIHQGIAFLLDHLPPQLHLVIAGRVDPPLPLSRLRGRAEMAELRAADLRFTADESAAFLNEVMGLHLPAQDVAALEARTEGWITGLQLAALSVQGREDVGGFISTFTGDDRYIIDYLVEEVLQRQSGDVRSFLLQTSILHRMSGLLCNAVTGRETGQAMLETLERANLFVVPLDDKRRWYRYHQLFADVLQARSMEEQPDEVLALHQRASEWFARNGEPIEAIHHALAAGDFERVASLVELVARATIRKSNQSARLLEWLKLVPDDLIRARPVLSTYYAFALLGMGEMDNAGDRLRDAELWLEASQSGPAGMVVADQAELRSLPGTIALARSFRAQALGDLAGTVEHARRALNLLPEGDHVWRGGAALLLALAQWTSGDLEAAQQTHADGVASLRKAGDVALATSAAYDAADLAKARGRLSEAGSIYRQALQFTLEHGDPALPGIADLHLGLSELHCERNELESATRNLRQSEQPGKHADLRETPYRRCIAWARLRQAEGDLQAALDLLEEAERLHVSGVVPDTHPVAAQKARVWIAQGRLSEAVDWGRQQGLSADDDLTYMSEFGHITLARILLAQGDDRSVGKIDALLERLLEAAELGGRTGSAIEILVLQALARRLLGDIPEALLPLERALTLAEPEGYVRIFVDEGTAMRDLLRHTVAQGISGVYARGLLAAFNDAAPQPAVSAPAMVAGLAEPLTARETEILGLVAAGMRNQEIADQLVISLATVKRHIANAYGKLGVTHRTEAVARLTS